MQNYEKSTFLLSLLLPILLTQAQNIPSADEVLKDAKAQAAKEGKNVFIIFHASWCGWSHKMDTAMNDRTVKKFFDDSYVIRHLTVLESANKKALENPGAEALFAKYTGGTLEGIPFWLIFDKNGTLLADSKMRSNGATTGEGGSNAGCPASEPEVAYFITVLRKTSPLKDEQLVLIAKRFREMNSIKILFYLNS